jgi:hypothetical protein
MHHLGLAFSTSSRKFCIRTTSRPVPRRSSVRQLTLSHRPGALRFGLELPPHSDLSGVEPTAVSSLFLSRAECAGTFSCLVMQYHPSGPLRRVRHCPARLRRSGSGTDKRNEFISNGILNLVRELGGHHLSLNPRNPRANPAHCSV